MKTIATFTTPEDAHLFRTFLESRGIRGHLLDEYYVQLFWYHSNAVGGVRLAVDEHDADEASTIYQEYMESLRQGPYPLQPVRAWPVVIMLSLLVGVPMMLFGRRHFQNAGSAE